MTNLNWFHLGTLQCHLTSIIELFFWQVCLMLKRLSHHSEVLVLISREERRNTCSRGGWCACSLQAFYWWLFCFVWRLVNAYGELNFRSIQLLPIVLFQNNLIFISTNYYYEIIHWGTTGSIWGKAHYMYMCLQAYRQSKTTSTVGFGHAKYMWYDSSSQ